MDLATATAAARDWTARLHARLAAGDLAGAAELLEGRAEALADFERAHRAAGPDACAACAAELSALQSEDRALQELAAGGLADADAACRAALGASAAAPGAYRDEPALACVDRRA